jgi:hypothetical protein
MDETLDNLMAQLEEKVKPEEAPQEPAPLKLERRPRPKPVVVSTETAWVDEPEYAPRRSADPFRGLMVPIILVFGLGLTIFLFWMSSYIYNLSH